MSDSGESEIHYLQDEGRRHVPGTVVRRERGPGKVELIPDPRGEWEVSSCERDSSFGGPALLRVGLRRVGR
jgi:hypothetical protein